MGWLHCHFMTGNLQPDDRLGDFTADRRVLTLTGMAAMIGVISAFVALALLQLIGFFTHLFYYHALDSRLVSPADNRLGVWALLVPIVGGLIVGLMARYGSERIRGHGIPEALEAILIGQSRMSARVAVLKPLSSAISIGTGGPVGAAGPILMTGGAPGSVLALGIAAAFGSGLLTWLVYACEDLFRKVPVHWMWWPLLGGAVIGLGGLLYPRALGVGYDTIHDLLTWAARRRGAGRLDGDQGGDLGRGPRLGDVGRRARPAPHHGGRARGPRGALDPHGRPRALGRARHGRADGRHDALPVHRRRVHGGAHARRERAAGAAGRVRRRRCRDRAPHEALDPHREGRAPRVSRDPRVHREPPAPLAGARRDGAPGATSRRKASGRELSRRAPRSCLDQDARARSRPLAGREPERARAGRGVRGARRDLGGVGAVRS